MLSARIVLFFTINSMIHISYVGLIINHMFSFECCVYCTHSVTEVYWTREPRKGTSLQPAHISQNGKLQFCTRSMLEDGPHRTKNREQWSGAHCLLNFVNCKCRHVSKGGGELPLPPSSGSTIVQPLVSWHLSVILPCLGHMLVPCLGHMLGWKFGFLSWCPRVLQTLVATRLCHMQVKCFWGNTLGSAKGVAAPSWKLL